MRHSDFGSNNKRREREVVAISSSSLPIQRKSRKVVAKTAILSLTHLDIPLISSAGGCVCDSVRLDPDWPYNLGRSSRSCDFVLDDRRVSKRHCQFLFDSVLRKVYVLDGFLLFFNSSFVVDEFRNRVVEFGGFGNEEKEKVRGSLNGIFVNGYRVRRGMAVEMSAGDEIVFGCGNEGVCSDSRSRVGFVVQKIVFEEEVVRRSDEDEFTVSRLCGRVGASMGNSQGSVSSGKGRKRVFASRANELIRGCDLFGSKCDDPFGRAKFLLNQCRDVLHSDDPVYYLQRCTRLKSGKEGMSDFPAHMLCSDTVKFQAGNEPKDKDVRPFVGLEAIPVVKACAELSAGNCEVALDSNHDLANVQAQSKHLGHEEENGVVLEKSAANDDPKVQLLNSVYKDGMQAKIGGNSFHPLGRSFT